MAKLLIQFFFEIEQQRWRRAFFCKTIFVEYKKTGNSFHRVIEKESKICLIKT